MKKQFTDFEIKKYQTEIDGNTVDVYPFIISTESIDRGGEKMTVKKIKLNNFKKNPIVLFQHNSWSIPIGKSIKEEIQTANDGSLMLVSHLVFNETDDEVVKIKQAVDGGFLNASSIGFNPLKKYIAEVPPVELQDKFREIKVWQEVELLEWSVVTIPMNQDAVLQKGYNDFDDEMKNWIDDNILEKVGRRNSQKDAKSLKNIIELANEIIEQATDLLGSEEPDMEQEEEEIKSNEADRQNLQKLLNNINIQL